MTIIGLIGLVLLAGLVLWGIYSLPIDPQLQAIARVLIIVGVCAAVIIWLMHLFQAHGGFNIFVQ